MTDPNSALSRPDWVADPMSDTTVPSPAPPPGWASNDDRPQDPSTPTPPGWKKVTLPIGSDWPTSSPDELPSTSPEQSNRTPGLADRFRHHPPANDAVAAAHTVARGVVAATAEFLDGILPPSREKALALTHLEESLMWANAAIARNLNPKDPT